MARKQRNTDLPTFDELIVPTLKALKILGGSGTIEEINENVYKIANIASDTLQIPHDENGLKSEIEYRLSWSRTYLKKYGLIDNSSRGVWALTNSDIDLNSIHPAEVVKKVRGQHKPLETKVSDQSGKTNIEISDQTDAEIDWKETLLNKLFNIAPSAFERLAQRLLRESGFVQVEVTGKTGDGGIDGKGIVKISGFLSFHVIFQCKRYKGSITPSQIRDFRGAIKHLCEK